MSGEDALDRLEEAVDVIAQNADAGLQAHQLEDGSWVVSIEPLGDAQGTWVVTADGPTRAMALSNLIANAKKQGIA